MQAYGRNQRLAKPGLGGVVSLEPQPFLQCHEAAPKSQWVMVEALWYRPSGWHVGLRLLRGRFEGKGAVGGRSPFPVADSPETTLPRPGLKKFTHPCLPQAGCEGVLGLRIYSNFRDALQSVVGVRLANSIGGGSHRAQENGPCRGECEGY
jgi:hypothetical protein